jgi:glycosyltransferase involved in cell wall biosynthesis
MAQPFFAADNRNGKSWNRNMKICMITSSFRRYEGDYAGQHVYAQAIGLSRRHDVYVIYPTDRKYTDTSGDPFIHCPFAYPFKTYPMAQVRGADIFNVSKLFTRMRSEIRRVQVQHGIDLFYAFWAIPSAFICSISCGGTPFIIGLAGSDDRVFGRGGMARPFIKYAITSADRIIALSQDLKLETMAMGVKEENIAVIPSGIDIDVYKPRNKAALRAELGLPESLLVVYTGSLFKLKRLEWLIRISAELGQMYDFHSLIIGDGPEKENLEEMAAQMNANNVHFLGKIPYNEVPFYLSASDILVLFSETEGLPSCVQEALASGIPVVATNVGGITDIVRSSITGYLVESENEAKECLAWLIESPQLVSRMGANARRFAEDYLDSEKVFEQVNAICESVPGTEKKSKKDTVRKSKEDIPAAVLPGKFNIGVMSTFPENFLSSLIDVQSPYAEGIHIVAPVLHREDVHFHSLRYDVGKRVVNQVLNQLTSQFRMSYEVGRLGKEIDFWIFFGGDVFLLPMLSAKILGIPAMLSLLGNLEHETTLKKNLLNPIQRFVRRLNCILADRIIVFSPGLVKKWGLERYNAKVIVAQSQFVDIDLFKVKTPLSERKKLVGYVGRLSPEKGIWNLVKSMSLVLKKDPGISFLVIGDGPLLDSIKEYLKNTGLNGGVRLLGKVPNEQVAEFMNEIRTLVIPSFSEGLPSTILEAMACGTPVLATPAGAIDEIITSGRTGFLLEDNSPEAIADGIIGTLNHPEIEAIAGAARELAEAEYSLSAARRNYRAVILAGSMLNGKPRKGTRTVGLNQDTVKD